LQTDHNRIKGLLDRAEYRYDERECHFQRSYRRRLLGRRFEAYWKASSHFFLRGVALCTCYNPGMSTCTNSTQTTSIALSDTVQEFLVPAVRKSSYSGVKHKRLQALLEKLAKYGAVCRDAPSRELGEKRRKEAEAVGRLFPGEGR
jgi:hypothetical protein